MNTVEPVVVRPDIASKKASTTLALGGPSQNGIAPKIGNTSQTPVASRKVCWMVSRSRTPLAQARAISVPVKKVTTEAFRNTRQCGRP